MVVIRFVWFLSRVMKKCVCAHKINVIRSTQCYTLFY